eukprot:TRINITY_DN66476_c0_g1_i1.p1 TRINITY_DN66476_c0_g1~~TRINITY_DN66476_c0_g1_i1.p1  ORF type:complete len:289 (-),score=55.65 TRINITY_DN66476_c0_g1_i1:276-1100(-)
MSCLPSYLGDVLATGVGADVVVVAGSGRERKELSAHSLLLCRSAYFNGALSVGFQESQTRRIVLEDVDPQLLSYLISILYTDAWPAAAGEELDAFSHVEMLVLSRRFLLPASVSSLTLEALPPKVVLGENMLRVLARALELELPEVVELCLKTDDWKHSFRTWSPAVLQDTLKAEYSSLANENICPHCAIQARDALLSALAAEAICHLEERTRRLGEIEAKLESKLMELLRVQNAMDSARMEIVRIQNAMVASRRSNHVLGCWAWLWTRMPWRS